MTSGNGTSNGKKLPLPLQIVGDPNRLRRILFNLMDNAIKFTSIGKVTLTVLVITSTCTAVDDNGNGNGNDNNHKTWLQFDISDTGIGVSPAKQEVIFQKYNRVAHDDQTNHYGGTGLGLNICRGLVEAMGGIIFVDSPVGQGSTFSFKIPLRVPVPCSRTSPKEVETPELILGEQQLSILVVEDNKINQKVVRAMLQRIGHSVTIAENGQLAVEAVKTKSFDLVLMDVMMPVMDGIQATKALRSMGLSKALLPIIGLTASFQHSERDNYLGIGMNDCLGKPVKLASLKRAIAQAVEERDLV